MNNINVEPTESTGWSNGKPTYSSASSYNSNNMKYPNGGSSWSQSASKPSYSSMSANPKYSSSKSGWQSKSKMSTAKNTALLAGGAYVGYRLGQSSYMGSYMMMPYFYGPYYMGYSPYYASPFMFHGPHYNRLGSHLIRISKCLIFRMSKCPNVQMSKCPNVQMSE